MSDLREKVEALSLDGGPRGVLVHRDDVLDLIPEGAVLVTAESLAAAFCDPSWQLAFHRWMTVGWSNTKNSEALPLAAAILARLRDTKP